MGIDEDIANAIGSLADSVPELAAEMRHGMERGKALQISARVSVDSISDSGPAEAVKYSASERDFPTLKNGEVVELDGSLHVVVSLSVIAGNFTIGLSDALDGLHAVYSGTRREEGKAHRFRNPIEIFAIREAAPPPDMPDAAAFSCEQSYLVCIAVDTWAETFPPQASDIIEFTDPKRTWETVRLKVSSVVRHDGWWMLHARPRGGA